KALTMREDKHRLKYRQRKARVGPDVIRKEPVDFDGCIDFKIWDSNTRDWKMRHEDSEALFRPDPFGVKDYFVDYSLNKKKRWAIKEEIKERLEEVQDPRLNLRVSSSIHAFDRSNPLGYEPFITLYYTTLPQDKLPCLEYHTVSRDGKTVVHKESESVGTRLRNFTHDARPPRHIKGERKKKGARKERTYKEKRDWTDRELPEDPKLEHQKLHVHYTTQKHTDLPSLHTKMANKQTRRHSRERRGKDVTSRHVVDIPDDVVFDAIDDVIIEDSFSIPTIVEDLSTLVVKKAEKRRGEKREPLRRFVDELLKTSFFLPTPGTSGYASEDDFEDEETPSTSYPSVPLVFLAPEMFTRFSLSTVPNLLSSPRLPCYPPAWEVHQRDSLQILGKYMQTCVVARQYGDEIRLTMVDDCDSTHPSRPHLPTSDETYPDIVCDSEDFCEICCGEMDLMSDDRLIHPFSLSCGHLFCAGCWLAHISESIHRQRLPAACLHPDCRCSVSVSAAKCLLNSTSVQAYEKATIDALKTAERLITCPECKRLHYTAESAQISCPCGASLCSHCSSVHHSPLGCDVFDQYNMYMRRSGFASIYSTSSDAPIVRNLAQCPKCHLLMQRSEGCNHLTCSCGMEFCYRCGNKWASSHYQCTKDAFTKVTMVDVFTGRTASLLVPSLLTLAIEARTILIDRRKELKKRLLRLPFLERRAAERAFVQLSLVVELCYLSYRRSRKARVLAEKVRFWLDEFFNTADKNLSMKARALTDLRESLIV
ncbi:hypothetical protein PMAYCL1PPCAC_01074, partial [Pristionchus mayeri]